jgi:hypothetical protein
MRAVFNKNPPALLAGLAHLLFQFRDQRPDVLRSLIVRYLTRQRLVSLDLIFEFIISSLIRRWGGRNVRF